MKDSGLYLESAILHGKLEEHDKALNILVHQLKDFPAAEDYCMWTAERKDVLYRQRLFNLLLSVYLNPDSPDDSLHVAGVDLVNKHSAEFDTAQVLKLLPGTWSVQLLAPFLAASMRESIHKQKMARLAVGLAKAENLIYKHEKVKMRGHPIVLSDKSVCHICRSPIQEPTFTRYPNGIIVHTHCAPSGHMNNTNIANDSRT